MPAGRHRKPGRLASCEPESVLWCRRQQPRGWVRQRTRQQSSGSSQHEYPVARVVNHRIHNVSDGQVCRKALGKSIAGGYCAGRNTGLHLRACRMAGECAIGAESPVGQGLQPVLRCSMGARTWACARSGRRGVGVREDACCCDAALRADRGSERCFGPDACLTQRWGSGLKIRMSRTGSCAGWAGYGSTRSLPCA